MTQRHAVRPAAVALATAVLSACVTRVVEPDPAVDLGALLGESVRIPLRPERDTESGRAVDAYYASVLAQLRDASLERDAERVRDLLAAHDRPTAPTWARASLQRFRGVARGLEIEQHLLAAGRVDLIEPDVAIGEVVALEFRVPPLTRGELPPGGLGFPDESPLRLVVHCVAEDRDVFGGTSRRSFSDVVVAASGAVDLADEFVVAFRVDALPAEGVIRRLVVRLDVAPGALRIGDAVVPLRGGRCASRELELYPRGVESVRASPYTSLRNGLASGDPAHFAHVHLAARFMPAELREDASRLLIQTVRLGRADACRVATTALSIMTGEPHSIADRDAWLRWWSRRERQRGG